VAGAFASAIMGKDNALEIREQIEIRSTDHHVLQPDAVGHGDEAAQG
jgi:hypothetical protein